MSILPVRESILVLQMLFEHQQQQDALNGVSKVQETARVIWEEPHYFFRIIHIQILQIRLGLRGHCCNRFSGLFRPPYHILSVIIVIVAVAVFSVVAPWRITVHLFLAILPICRVLDFLLYLFLLTPRLL